jgi:septum formation protein
MSWLAASPLLLASRSKARQDLLRSYGIEFETAPVDFDERAFEKNNQSLKPDELALALATEKARKAREIHADRLVLAADQILLFENAYLHQCQTYEEAIRQLQTLSGKTHYLISAAVLLDDNNHQEVWQETAEMQMRDLTEKEIKDYFDLEGPELLKSVGCYHFESHGRKLFSQVKGSVSEILGMPMDGLCRSLMQKGYLAA